MKSDRVFRNAVLVSIDALSPDHLSCYGYRRRTTPHIDRALHAGGVLFENAFSQAPFTTLSHASLFTSLYMLTHRVRDWDVELARANTLAKVLGAHGRLTGGFTNHLGLCRKAGYATGFDAFACRTRIEKISHPKDLVLPGVYLRRSARFLMKQLIRAIRKNPTEISMDFALRWIEAHYRRPFFAFIHLFACHPPFKPPAPCDTMFTDPSMNEGERVTALHDGEIAYTDNAIGLLLKRLAALGVLEDTLVVLCADHGNTIKGVLKPRDPSKALCRLYEESIRVPLIFLNPSIASESRCTKLAQLIDIFPTVLSLTGIEERLGLHGRDLSPWVLGKAAPQTGEIYSNCVSDPMRWTAIRSEEWKFIYNETRNEGELYDLAHDPNELQDISSERKEVVERFLDDHRRWKQRITDLAGNITEDVINVK